MSSPTKKHNDFVKESMGDKDVAELPGIGDDQVRKLKGKGYYKAYMVLGRFLDLDKNQEAMERWLREDIGINQRYCRECVKGLKEWCDQHL